MLRSCIGKELLEINRVQFYFNDIEQCDGDGDLEFLFADNSYLSLTGSGDAESILAKNDSVIVPETFEVADYRVCSWQKHNLNEENRWNKLIGQKIIYIDIIKIWKELIIGCIIQFEIDNVIFYETESNTNRFIINEIPKWIDNNPEIVIERYEKNEC